MKQVAVTDKEKNSIVGGIMLDNGDVIMCDVGDLIPAEKIGNDKPYVIEKEFATWVDLTHEIIEE